VSPQIVIKGLDETIAHFDGMNNKIIKAVTEAVQQSAERVRDDAKARAPIATGKLFRDIRIKKSQDGLAAEITYTGKKRAFYGKFVEFGTKKMPARPFLGPAWQKEEPAFLEKVTAAINEGAK
jgi:HK97 gp10 family phage protein